MRFTTKKSQRWRLFGQSNEPTETASTERPSFAEQAQAALDAPAPETEAEGKGLYRCDCTLAELKPGQCGTILRLLGTTQGRLRLLEMGMTPGTHVKVLRVAAFGGPLDVLVRGYQLSLRREEAVLIWLGEED